MVGVPSMVRVRPTIWAGRPTQRKEGGGREREHKRRLPRGGRPERAARRSVQGHPLALALALALVMLPCPWHLHPLDLEGARGQLRREQGGAAIWCLTVCVGVLERGIGTGAVAVMAAEVVVVGMVLLLAG
jgi:hypothetical protein